MKEWNLWRKILVVGSILFILCVVFFPSPAITKYCGYACIILGFLSAYKEAQKESRMCYSYIRRKMGKHRAMNYLWFCKLMGYFFLQVFIFAFIAGYVFIQKFDYSHAYYGVVMSCIISIFGKSSLFQYEL